MPLLHPALMPALRHTSTFPHTLYAAVRVETACSTLLWWVEGKQGEPCLSPNPPGALPAPLWACREPGNGDSQGRRGGGP